MTDDYATWRPQAEADWDDYDLRECPFCGEPGKLFSRPHFGEYRVDCRSIDCNITGPGHETADAAVDAWNTRPLEAASQARETQARALLEELLKDRQAWYDSDGGCCRFCYEMTGHSTACVVSRARAVLEQGQDTHGQ